MPKSWLTITLFLAFLITAAALQWWQAPQYPVEVKIVLCAGILIFLLVGISLKILRPRSAGISFLFFCVALGVSIAFLRVAQTTHVTTSDSIESIAIEKSDEDRWKDFPAVTLHGYIVAEPDRRPLKTKYTVEVDSASGSAFHGKILATDHSMYPRHDYGDEVTVTGVLEKPGQIEDFHYDRYLSRYGIHSVMYRASVKTISNGHGNKFFAYLFKLKEKFESQINRLYPEPHASFMAGLITGSRRGIPQHLLDDFQTTGLTHIIAISGYNIAIVIAVISGAFFFLPLKWRFAPSIFAIVAFTFFVGASPSVVRAAIMGGLGLFALQVGRQKHSLIAILFTAAVMTACNPKILWYDAGFQLSFLSVLGLSYLAPFLEKIFACVPKILGLRESLQMTVAAQLAAVPLIVVLFSHFSVIAPIANVVVAPFIPLAMLFGFAGAVVSFFFEPLGLLIAYLGWGALEVIICATKFFAEVPHALISTGNISNWFVWGYYLVLIVVLALPWTRKKFLVSGC